MAIGGVFVTRLQDTQPSRDSRQPKYTKFSQQELGSCKPLLTPKANVCLFAALGLACICIGVGTLLVSLSVVELSTRYDDVCMARHATAGGRPLASDDDRAAFLHASDAAAKQCSIVMDVAKLMRQPVFVYYQLGNYFQNHRRYVRSKSERQLRGLPASSAELSDCKPEDTSNGRVIVPCGLIAWSLFNDTFEFSTNSFAAADGAVVVNKTGISWPSDREDRFNRTVYPANFVNNQEPGSGSAPTGTGTAATESGGGVGGGRLDESRPLHENENLMVWMRTSALPTFRKLYGRIETDLQAGTQLSVNIGNVYNSYGFGGSKKLVLSTASWIGGRNHFLGLSFLLLGCSSLLTALVFLCLHWRCPPMADPHPPFQHRKRAPVPT